MTVGHDEKDWLLEASARALADLEYIEMALEAFRFARQVALNATHHTNTHLGDEMHIELYAAYGRAAQRVFVMSTIDPRAREKAKELAVKKFFQEGDKSWGSSFFGKDSWINESEWAEVCKQVREAEEGDGGQEDTQP